MSAHTPGPWTLFPAPRGVAIDGPCRVTIAWCGENASFGENSYKISRDEALANARLVGAAPDLLEALIMIRDADDDCARDGLQTIPAPARAKIDAAIAKAEGKP